MLPYVPINICDLHLSVLMVFFHWCIDGYDISISFVTAITFCWIRNSICLYVLNAQLHNYHKEHCAKYNQVCSRFSVWEV